MHSPIHDNPPPAVSLKKNRRDQAVDNIKHYIRSHQMKPLELLPPVRALSDHFELSRDSVWRALRSLQDEGWINVRPNRRYEIAKDLYTKVLSSLRVKAIFTGISYIHFSGFRRLADALKRECRYHNMDLSILLLPLDTEPSKEVWKDCDVLMVDSNSSRSLLKRFDKFKVPVVGMDADYSDRYHLNIVTDHHLGGRMAAERLLTKGSKKVSIVHFRGSQNDQRIKARIEGFRQSWLETGRDENDLNIMDIEWSENHFEVSLNVKKALEGFGGQTDFFVSDGTLAVTCLDILDHLKYSVPNDLRLIGYDGAQMGEITNPPMTTIQQDMDTIGATAVKRLVEFTGPHRGKTELIRVPPLLIGRISG